MGRSYRETSVEIGSPRRCLPPAPPMVQPARQPHRTTRMADSEQINADQLAFWNGAGGQTWVARQPNFRAVLQEVRDLGLGP